MKRLVCLVSSACSHGAKMVNMCEPRTCTRTKYWKIIIIFSSQLSICYCCMRTCQLSIIFESSIAIRIRHLIDFQTLWKQDFNEKVVIGFYLRCLFNDISLLNQKDYSSSVIDFCGDQKYFLKKAFFFLPFLE